MSYNTVMQEVQSNFIVKKSKFIGTISPVTSEKEANEFISKIKSKYWDATHNVYAYVLREENKKRYSDDGEPTGTAGIPILNVIERSFLTDVCIVVTRYFGGIMLGAGGLVRAYSKSAVESVNTSDIVTFYMCDLFKFELDYSMYNKILHCLKEYNCKIHDSEYGTLIKLSIYVDEILSQNFLKDVNKLSNGRIIPKFISKNYCSLK